MGYELDAGVELSDIGDGAFGADLGAGWKVGGGLNGGYLLAVLGNAVRERLPEKPDVLAISAHYLSATVAGAATVSTRVVRDGGRIGTVAAELDQEGDTRITALVSCGDLASASGEVVTTAEMPTMPSVEDCLPGSLAPEELRRASPLLDRVDIRLDPAHAEWVLGKPSGRGVIQGWFRLADGREPDPLSLLLTVDAFPPVTFDLGLGGWAPTVALSVHLRAVPAPGWLQVRVSTRNVAGGMFEEDAEVWDETGRLVAQSRQLALLPRD